MAVLTTLHILLGDASRVMMEDLVFLRTGELSASLFKNNADIGLIGESRMRDFEGCISKQVLGLNYLLVI